MNQLITNNSKYIAISIVAIAAFMMVLPSFANAGYGFAPYTYGPDVPPGPVAPAPVPAPIPPAPMPAPAPQPAPVPPPAPAPAPAPVPAPAPAPMPAPVPPAPATYTYGPEVLPPPAPKPEPLPPIPPKIELPPPVTTTVVLAQASYNYGSGYNYTQPVQPVLPPPVPPQPIPPPPVKINLDIACYVDPIKADLNQPVTWTVEVAGGVAPYAYAWSGSEGLIGNQSSVVKFYSTPGTKYAVVSVTSSDGKTGTHACSNKVTVAKAATTYSKTYVKPTPKATATPCPTLSATSTPSPTPVVNQVVAETFSLANVPWGWVAILVILILFATVLYLLFNRTKI